MAGDAQVTTGRVNFGGIEHQPKGSVPWLAVGGSGSANVYLATRLVMRAPSTVPGCEFGLRPRAEG